jgi:Cytochrome b5-like Heme/Steroid binding domain
MGLTVLCCVTLPALGGILTRWKLERQRWGTADVLKLKFGHQLFGYLVIGVSQVTLLLGGLAYADGGGSKLAETLSIILFITFFGLIVLFEILFRMFKRRETPFVEPERMIPRAEFDQRVNLGENLVLLDDLVLDVTRFKSEHPGGQFLLQFHLGRDVSKFFYGGYVLENESGMKPYTHSNVARTVVNSLAIGKLVESA